jgi:RNA polymerase sigma-70 factor, ECF subfamily
MSETPAGGHGGTRDVSQTPPLDLTRVHDAYYAKVVACATKFLGRADADDVAQEVFVKIDRSLGGLSEPSKVGAWVYAITLNTVRDFARKRRSTPDGLGVSRPTADGIEDARELADGRAHMPDEAIERREMIACYLEHVNQLPTVAREVYVLSEFEGLSDEEISRRLSVSRGTVKIRLHRARTRLVDALRRNCQCYRSRRGELMGEPRRA